MADLTENKNITLQQPPRITQQVGEILDSSKFISEAKELTRKTNQFEYPKICKDCLKDFIFTSPRQLSEWQLENFDLNFCEDCRRARKEKETFLMRESRWQEICPPLYLANDREKLPDEEAKKSYDKIQNYIFLERGLVVHGLTRRGKTRAVWERMKKGYMNTGLEPKFAFGGMFSLQIAESFEDHETIKLINSFANAPIVFFDDIGQMIFTERVQECLFTVLETRCSYLRPTVFTMNDIGNTLKDKFSGNRGEAFTSRLKEFCEIIKF